MTRALWCSLVLLSAMAALPSAQVPPGADAIVMVELTDRAGDTGVLVRASVPEGNHIRRIGEDVTPGDVVVTAGVQALRPGQKVRLLETTKS